METQSLVEAPQVTVKPSERLVEFKTKIRFLDVNRKHETIVSVQPPTITQAGTLQFLLSDRLINYPVHGVLMSWETEQLATVEPSKIIIGDK